MAKKFTPPQKPAREDGSKDLEILNPDVPLPIAGRDIVVREYGFVEGLRVRVKAKALTEALGAQIKTGHALLEDIQDVLAAHWDLVRELIADSTGQDHAWIESLNEADGELLLLTWWGVCGPFFVGIAVRRMRQDRQVRAALAGLTSTPASPRPDTESPTGSDATPSAS